MIYKKWNITFNEWGYFEAYNLEDCDAYMLHDKTLEGLKTQIDELF